MSSLTTDRIRDRANRLGLTHLTQTITQLVDRAEAGQMGYLDFVDLLLEDELGLREGRRFRNASRLSGLPHQRPSTSPTSPSKPTSTPAKSATWQPRNSSGPSPTSLCSAARRGEDHDRDRSPSQPAKPGSPSTSPPWTTWCAAPHRRSHRPVHPATRTYLQPAALIVDKVGYLPVDRAEANMVFQLVSRRYERGSLIITSNKSFAEWGGVLGGDVLAAAILDRLLHHCDVITINVPSHRFKDRFNTAPKVNPCHDHPCRDRHVRPYLTRHTS